MTLVIDRIPSQEDLYTVALHEFGHSLGLPDLVARDNVMYKFHKYGSNYCPGEADRRELELATGCTFVEPVECPL